jgi:hypothetical protein
MGSSMPEPQRPGPVATVVGVAELTYTLGAPGVDVAGQPPPTR